MASDLPSLNLPSWQGVTGLPGAAGNSNPLGSTNVIIGGQETQATLPTSPTVPTFGGLFQSQPGSELDTLNNQINNSAPGSFSLGNMLSNGINSLFGTNLSVTNPNGTTTNGAIGTTSGLNTSTISDLFLRSVIIILGFIFVAVGLSMFRNNSTIVETLKGKS